MVHSTALNGTQRRDKGVTAANSETRAMTWHTNDARIGGSGQESVSTPSSARQFLVEEGGNVLQ